MATQKYLNIKEVAAMSDYCEQAVRTISCRPEINKYFQPIQFVGKPKKAKCVAYKDISKVVKLINGYRGKKDKK